MTARCHHPPSVRARPDRLHLVRRRLRPPELASLVHEDQLARPAKNPARAHTFELPAGRATVFFPEVGDTRCTAILHVEVDVVGMVRAGRAVEDAPLARALHREQVALVDAAPSGLPESDPDEALRFCVTTARVALRTADGVDGTDPEARIRGWTASAARALVEPGPGLLGASFRADGAALDGPEWSAIGLVAANVLSNPGLARDQYDRALLGAGPSRGRPRTGGRAGRARWTWIPGRSSTRRRRRRGSRSGPRAPSATTSRSAP